MLVFKKNKKKISKPWELKKLYLFNHTLKCDKILNIVSVFGLIMGFSLI